MFSVKTIAYVTGTRADFGLMTPVLSAIAADSAFTLRVYATGMHLMPVYGSTMQEVEKHFPDMELIEADFRSPDRAGMASFLGVFIKQLTDVFSWKRPDIVLVLGDRVEMLGVACVCTYLGIPFAHLHGGDVTDTVDDQARRAITALATLHLPATEAAAGRLRSWGVDSTRITVVGAPGLDVILNKTLPTRAEVCAHLSLDPEKPFLLVTQHPVTESWEAAGEEMRTTLDAVLEFDLPIVTVYPNTDAGGSRMIAVIEEYTQQYSLIRPVKSLPYELFLAVEREAAVWIGNSSAGVIESASFKTPVVNVGTRQNGRERGENVVDVPHEGATIRAAVTMALFDEQYRASLATVVNPWGDGKTAQRVMDVLRRTL